MTSTQSSLRTRSMELLMTYHNGKDQADTKKQLALRNRLVKLNAGLVRKIAHRTSRQCSEPYEDLEQIGYIGLIRAIERFDPTQGCAFSSFAVPYIRGEMLHFLRDRSSAVKVPRRWQDLQKAAQKVQLQLTKELERSPTDVEIATAMNITLQEWQDIRMAAKNRSPLSLDATLSYQMDSPITLGDTLPDAHEQILRKLDEDRQQLQRALNQLEEKTRVSIESVFFKGLSRKEVAEHIGVSPMTVTRRIQRGIDQLSAILQPQSV